MTDTLERVLPNIEQISIPFTWMPVSDVWGMYSMDFCDGITEPNLEEKRGDQQYNRLLNDIRVNGIRWPITVKHGIVGNGHHRLAACIELGYTHIPVQDDYNNEYSYMKNTQDIEDGWE